jgi:hypothetical protein
LTRTDPGWIQKYFIRKKGIISMANFKDGVVRDGSFIGSGRGLGNIKDGVIRDGSSAGSGRALGNVKDGVIRDGSSRGSGRALFNVKGDFVRNGSSSGSGTTIGKISEYNIKGMERELDADIVATYHFLIKKII